MSFSASAAGDRRQVIDSLNTQAGTMSDGMGPELIELFETFINDGAEPGEGERYVVSLSGHSAPRSLVSLTATIRVEPVPPTATGNEMGAEGTAATPVQEAAEPLL